MTLTAQSLYSKLRHYKVGSPLCEFTEDHCASLLPTLQRIEQLKQEKMPSSWHTTMSRRKYYMALQTIPVTPTACPKWQRHRVPR